MPLHFETAKERDALTKAWGDTAISQATGIRIPGQYNEPSADVALMQARAPEFIASFSAFEAALVVVGSTLIRIETFSGRTVGPFKVISWDRSEDGNFITAGLQSI